MFYIELRNSSSRRRVIVIETARSEPGAKRMARALARQRFGDPFFVVDRPRNGGGYWRELATDGETAGQEIHVTGSCDDTH
jgi:hypothetical protein